MFDRRILAAFVVLISLVAAGCGSSSGSSSSSNESAKALLAETFSSGPAFKSGLIHVQLDSSVQGLTAGGGPLTLRLSGPFESGSNGQMPRFDFTLGITAAGASFTAGGVSTGDRGFLLFQGQPYEVNRQMFAQLKQRYAQAQKQGSKSKGTTFAALGIDPSRWLRDPRRAGEQQIGGADTIHITSGIAVPQFLSDLNAVLSKARSLGATTQAPQQLTPKQRSEIAAAVQDARVDVFTGKDDHALRRLDLRVKLRKTSQTKAGAIRFQVQIDQLNQSQTIKAPAHAKPLDDLLSQLRALDSGSSSGSGSSGSSGSAGSSSSSGGGALNVSPQYAQCVQKAGTDLRKQQDCANLL
jgi:hypothetical protein